MGKAYKLMTKDSGKWKFKGMFPERYVEQLCNAAINQAKKGKRMYKTMRVVERSDNGDLDILR